MRDIIAELKTLAALSWQRYEELANELSELSKQALGKRFRKKITTGTTRSVYFGPDYVVKVARGKKGIKQNRKEYRIFHGTTGKMHKKLAPVYALSDDERILIMARAEKATPFTIKELRKLGAKEVYALGNQFREFQDIYPEFYLVGREWNQMEKFRPAAMVFLDDGRIGFGGDYLKQDSWGILNGRYVLIDYGY